MPKTRHNDRKCIATGEAIPPGGFGLRFARSPEGILVPDIGEKLPGRGAWTLARRDAVEKALSKGLFKRAFKADVRLADDKSITQLLGDIDQALAFRVLGALGLAKRAGLVVTGSDTVKSKTGNLLAYLTPCDAAADGVRKIKQRLEPGGRVAHISLAIDSGTLSHALGDFGVVHVGLLPGKAAQTALFEIGRWQGFLPEPVTDSA